ncbi:MAG: NTP transferase domain-containing protein [Mediterraneibacter sp.]
MRVGAVIAAAGVPGGFAAYEKTDYTDGPDMVKRMIQVFHQAGVEDVAVITGYKARETEKSLSKLGAVFLRSPDYAGEQMLDYAVRGLDYFRKSCERIFFCPADVPLFSVQTVKAMTEAESPVVIPVYEGRKGHPILIHADLVPGICAYRGGRGLKGAVDASGAAVCLLPVDDAGVALRAGADHTFEEMASSRDIRQIYPRVKVQLVRNEPFFGPGIVTLLKQIQALGSVREACEKTGMSYSKGWSLIRTAERETGYTIVDRSPGGKGGGAARVSERGRKLLEQYERFEKEIARIAREKYREIFE